LTPDEQLSIRDAMTRASTALERRTGKASAAFIAVATGANENSVKAYLDGRRRPPASFIRDFAQAAGIPASELFVALGWLPAEEAIPADAVGMAEHIASVAATLGRLEPHVRRTLDTARMAAPAPFAAAAALLAGVDGASRFDARLFHVVSGDRYRAITNGGVEFSLRPGVEPLSPPHLERLVRSVGMAWRPDVAAAAADPAYWSVQSELRARTYAVLHDSDIGQFTWQGEPGTRTWTEETSRWPAHLLVQDPFGGVSRPGRTADWRPTGGRTLVVVGARYSAGPAAAMLAEALGWQFVPVRSDIEVTADGRIFPVARDRVTGRILAWSSVARYIEQRHRERDPWRSVVLLRPSALRGRQDIDEYALGLLRDTPASILYVRPPQAFLTWWAARQMGASITGAFDADGWLARTRRELETAESIVTGRPAGDLYLALAEPERVLPTTGAGMPAAIMDAQAYVAWTALRWLDDVANRGQPSLRSRILPGTLANWMPTLSADSRSRVPALNPSRR
jgi:hypothetical protein